MKLTTRSGHVNLKRVALELQTMLLDKDMEGFEAELEAINVDGKLISIKLNVEAPC